MGTGVDTSQKIVAIVINQTQPCDFEVGQMIVSQSSNIKLKIYRNFQNYEEEEGWGSSSARRQDFTRSVGIKIVQCREFL